MKSLSQITFSLLLAMSAAPVMAGLTVFACEPEWAALGQELGGEKVQIYSATTALQDPHRIEARPSLIARARRADLMVCSGAELETGWLPLLLRQSANAKIQVGQPGYFEAAMQVNRLGIPAKLDRAEGDIHAAGNPHVHLDPRRLLIIAAQLTKRMQSLDPDNSAYYQTRFADFKQRWQQAINKWQRMAKPLQGARIIVHHKDWLYLFDWLGISIAGTLEPKPGLPTTAGHLVKLRQQLQRSPATMIVHAAYQHSRAADRLSRLTGIPVLALPYTVGGMDKANDLFGLFDVTLQRMLEIKQ